MSQTIMMPASFDLAVREMCGDAVSQAVAALAEKYGFDQEEALRELNLGDLKLARKRGPSPKKETEKSVTKKAKGEKPKRAKTGYLLYADSCRAEVQLELSAQLGEAEKLKPQDVVKAIAARWKAEEAEVRTAWNEQAKAPPSNPDALALQPGADSWGPNGPMGPRWGSSYTGD
jgi:hypothetical protein